MKTIKTNRRILNWAAFCILIFVAVSGVQAYVLPAPHILDLMIPHLGSARALEITQKNIFLEQALAPTPCSEDDLNCSDRDLQNQNQTQTVADDARPSPAAIQETVRYAIPRAFRSDMFAPPSDRTHIFSVGRSATVVDGSVSNQPESYFDYYKHLLLYRSRHAFKSRLSERGINLQVSSLGRLEDRIAYVLGAVYPDLTLPQVWVDKETLLPIRWIVKGADDGTDTAQFEIRYLDWRQIDRIWYPDQIEFIRNGTPVRLIQIENVVLDPELSGELFSIDRLLSRSQQAEGQSDPENPEGGMSDIQKTIEEFKRLFE